MTRAITGRVSVPSTDGRPVCLELWARFPSQVLPVDVPLSHLQTLPVAIRDRLTASLLVATSTAPEGRFEASLAADRSALDAPAFYRVFDGESLVAAGRLAVPDEGPLFVEPSDGDRREWPVPPVALAGAAVALAAVGVGIWALSGRDDDGGPGDGSFSPPPLDRTVGTDFAESVTFLYTGDDPIQKGVNPDDIDPARVAVLRGRVTDRDGSPLPDVRVSVPGHPEFGYTHTRGDGMFDMAVNGGARLTVRYERDGYLSVQRERRVPWRQFVSYPAVALTSIGGEPTTVSMNADELQVVRGPGASDGSGSRQTTVFVRAGTTATVEDASGERRPDSVELRALEYTVGDRGPEAMPDRLPPSTAYTYATEIAVEAGGGAGDESAGELGGALLPRPFLGRGGAAPSGRTDSTVQPSADAGDVRFDPPLVNYVENFLGFPVGTATPAGYYDENEAAWVPAPDGRVVAVLGESGDRATLDVDGSGQPADETTLRDLGVTDAERRELARLYDSGAELWRTPLPHLSPWDVNWPFGMPDDAAMPLFDIPWVPYILSDAC